MQRASIWILLGSLAGLTAFSCYLAATRIYQVDECNELIVAKVLATGHARTYLGSIDALHFPLSWAVHGAARSADYFRSGRWLMVAIFWLNLALIAVATGERLLSRRGLVALLGAATLAPLWDYGFEIRHDNLLLTGLLLTWCILRVRPNGLLSYGVAGALALALQITAHKAFAYTVPITLAILAFPPPGYKAPRWKLAAAWAAGALAMLLVLVAVYTAYGAPAVWSVRMSSLQIVSNVAGSTDRFGPWITLKRLPGQTPLLLALVASGLVALAVDLRRRGRAAVSWDGNLPEALLLGLAFGALIVNPTPFPYNLVNLVPYAFLFAFRHASALFDAIRDERALLPLAGAVVVFVHLAPFGIATRRHWDRPNARQTCLTRLAEDLTDPAKDPVFDAIGMVLTRPSIGPPESAHPALLHSLTFKSFVKGSGPQVRDMLAARPAAVIIPSYRTDWLPEEDKAAIRERYVPLADDFLVLGKVLPAGGGTFQIFQPGRYRITSLPDSDVAPESRELWKQTLPPTEDAAFTATLDGAPAPSHPVELTAGSHRLECPPGSQAAVVWIGPKLDRVGRLSPGDHRLLFFNWY